jgi:predicted Zn-dependent protease
MTRQHTKPREIKSSSKCLIWVVAALLCAPPAAWPQPAAVPTLGSPASAELSPAVERRLGEAIMVQGRRDPEYINDPDLSQYLNEMGRKIAAFAPGGAPQVDVFGVRNPIVNAFAMPGGFIGVQTGLIVLAGGESELAGVVAHEIAHVTQRHIARGLTQQTQGGHLALATLAAAILAAMIPGGGQAAMGIAAFGQAAMIDRQLGFSRDAEQEADRTGVEMLRKAGYDPNGMALMFGRLMSASSLNEGRGGGVYATTHPLSIQRMTDMQNRVRQFPASKAQGSDEFWFVRAKSRVLQALDPRALRQALDQMEEEARAPSGEGGASEAQVRRAAAWYGVSLVALSRQDPAAATTALQQAQSFKISSPYLDLQKIDIDIANRQYAAALTGAQAGSKRWPTRRSFAMRMAQTLQGTNKDAEAANFLKTQIKRWPNEEPDFYKMLAASQDRLGEPIAAKQSMAAYYERVGALPAAVTQLQQARAQSQDFYMQSQIDGQIRILTTKIADDRRLLERFK